MILNLFLNIHQKKLSLEKSEYLLCMTGKWTSKRQLSWKFFIFYSILISKYDSLSQLIFDVHPDNQSKKIENIRYNIFLLGIGLQICTGSNN